MRDNLGYYGTQDYQQTSWLGEILGALGNSMQGGEDPAMYADPYGAPYGTVAGAQNFGAGASQAGVQAGMTVAQGVKNLTAPVLGFGIGLIQGGGLLLGAGVIVAALINESRS